MTKAARVFCLAAAVGAAWLMVPSGTNSVAASEEGGVGGFVGAETCLTCHEGHDQGMGPHGSEAFAARAVNTCETCHGPGQAHAEADDPALIPPRVTDLSADQRNAICTSCHSGGEQLLWQGSTHQRRDVSCIDCHSVHNPTGNAQLVKATELETCGNCHGDVRAEFWRNSHHPVREGKITCSDCHNPHGGTGDANIRQATVNEQCYSCHTEKRGPFLWEHAPVRENCLNCHGPHGTNHQKLQKTSVPFLCQQCHANTRHPGTLYDGATLADQARASNRIFNRACLDCHASIHGSNHPSSPYLGH